jgi:hypothetical protein
MMMIEARGVPPEKNRTPKNEGRKSILILLSTSPAVHLKKQGKNHWTSGFY